MHRQHCILPRMYLSSNFIGRMYAFLNRSWRIVHKNSLKSNMNYEVRMWEQLNERLNTSQFQLLNKEKMKIKQKWAKEVLPMVSNCGSLTSFLTSSILLSSSSGSCSFLTSKELQASMTTGSSTFSLTTQGFSYSLQSIWNM